MEDLRKQAGDDITKLPMIKVADQDIKLDPTKKKVSINNLSSPWAWLRASLSIGFRF